MDTLIAFGYGLATGICLVWGMVMLSPPRRNRETEKFQITVFLNALKAQLAKRRGK